MRANGKYHCSVFEAMLFPVLHLIQVVPPSLHIKLRGVLRSYNNLLGECKDLDIKEISATLENTKNEINQGWEVASLKFQQKHEQLVAHGITVMEL